MLTLTDVLAPADGVIARESEDELLVVLPEQGEFIVLNETGAEMLQLLDGQRTLEEVAGALKGRYDHPPLEQVEDDVLTLARIPSPKFRKFRLSYGRGRPR